MKNRVRSLKYTFHTSLIVRYFRITFLDSLQLNNVSRIDFGLFSSAVSLLELRIRRYCLKNAAQLRGFFRSFSTK